MNDGEFGAGEKSSSGNDKGDGMDIFQRVRVDDKQECDLVEIRLQQKENGYGK